MRFASVAILGMLLGADPVTDGGAAAAGPSATLDCARAAGPGRVRCDVEAHAPAGSVLKWADVVVVDVPPFASALRARVGPGEASLREDATWRWTLALAAKSRGAGEIGVRVRLVSCAGEACTPTELSVRGPLVVGD